MGSTKDVHGGDDSDELWVFSPVIGWLMEMSKPLGF